MDTRIAVVGLGYVGLPLALAFAKTSPHVWGFDIQQKKIEAIRAGIDPTDEGLESSLKSTTLQVTSSVSDLKECTFFIVGVPTPVDENKNPDLGPVIAACRSVATVLKKGDVVVFESTVYPGVTEDICGPLLAEGSGLSCGTDFFLGYSPERINPGDMEHSLTKIVKVVSGQDAPTLERVAEVYRRVIKAGVHKATSIKVAEAAKVIENTQRDLNIALMNELAIIFDKMGIATKDVLDAASTKWNFLRFTPGLVGGHCIGVDPYYLTTKAQQLGYHPQVILAGRRINDDMGIFIAQRTIKLLIQQGIQPHGAKVGILGITFKENVSDVRNSRVPDIYHELKDFGAVVKVHDPHGDSEAASHEYGISLEDVSALKDLDCLIVAVPHKEVLAMFPDALTGMLKKKGLLIDVKSVISPDTVPNGIHYWSL